MQNSKVITLDKASDEVKLIAQEKASAIIGEAVRSAEIPQLDQISIEAKSIAEEKASILIEQAVKTVKVSPLESAPGGVQLAAKEAAAVLVSEAVINVREEKPVSNIKDFIIGGLAIVLLFLLYKVMKKNQKNSKKGSDQVLASSLKEIDEELKKFDQTLEEDGGTEEQKRQWTEKREHKRVQWNFPISLSLDENNPVFAMVKNISLSGVFAVCNDISLLRTLGDQSQFKFNFTSKDPNFPIHGRAEVVRIRSNRGLGLKFLDLDQSGTSHLQNLA